MVRANADAVAAMRHEWKQNAFAPGERIATAVIN
jgi:hypothetical protein